MVGDDAAHEVGGGIAQRGHQLPQLLLVELPHGAEHALLGLGGAGQRALRHLGHLVQAHDAVHCGHMKGDVGPPREPEPPQQARGPAWKVETSGPLLPCGHHSPFFPLPANTFPLEAGKWRHRGLCFPSTILSISETPRAPK